MNDERKYFYCYSTNLYKFLKQEELFYICSGLNENTLRKFWLYVRDDKLNYALRDYKEQGEKFKQK
ncbi:hypothetical protein MTP04_34390 [Lysinibacillus sp. PLM2]|nr:hypothetical protein MTP04_34390 [Lysinibacillus sp. PLM2]